MQTLARARRHLSQPFFLPGVLQRATVAISCSRCANTIPTAPQYCSNAPASSRCFILPITLRTVVTGGGARVCEGRQGRCQLLLKHPPHRAPACLHTASRLSFHHFLGVKLLVSHELPLRKVLRLHRSLVRDELYMLEPQLKRSLQPRRSPFRHGLLELVPLGNEGADHTRKASESLG